MIKRYFQFYTAWFRGKVRDWLFKKDKQRLFEEDTNRRQVIGSFFSEVLPEMDPDFKGKTVVLSGEWNYCVLPSGKHPLFDLAYPQLQLFVCIAGPLSSDWEFCYQVGFTRKEWEQYQEDLACIEEIIPRLKNETWENKPHLVVLKWGDPVNNLSIYRKVKEALNDRSDF